MNQTNTLEVIAPNALTLEQKVRMAQVEAGDGDDWEYGAPAVMQRLLDQGIAFHMEGSCGRQAMDYLAEGICFLPDRESKDYYGNRIPARGQLEAGSKGTLENSARHYGVS